MAKTKAKRNKKYDHKKGKAKHIGAVLNSAMARFYIMGDMNHSPVSFHISRIKMMLKGEDLKIALEEVDKFLYAERRLWYFGVYHFFATEGGVEAIPSIIKIPDSILTEVGDFAEVNIETSKQAVLNSEEGLSEDNYLFYGYYINYGEDLQMNLMEKNIIDCFIAINKDFNNVSDERVTCTSEKIMSAVDIEKFLLIDTESLKSKMVERG